MLRVIVVDLRHRRRPRRSNPKNRKATRTPLLAIPTRPRKFTALIAPGADSPLGKWFRSTARFERPSFACGSRRAARSTGADLDDLVRFNEAIDQAIAESITRYTEDLDHSKEMFLAILGHDLRTPLGAVLMSSQFMLDTGDLVEPHRTLTTRIAHSATPHESAWSNDLLDFTRTSAGVGRSDRARRDGSGEDGPERRG